MVTLGGLSRTRVLPGRLRVRSAALGLRDSPLWRSGFPERLAGKEVLGFVRRVCSWEGLWTDVLKTYCALRREETRGDQVESRRRSRGAEDSARRPSCGSCRPSTPGPLSQPHLPVLREMRLVPGALCPARVNSGR